MIERVFPVNKAYAALRDGEVVAGSAHSARSTPGKPASDGLIERDLPYYSSAITPDFVTGMNPFARNVGILKGNPDYADVVAMPSRGRAGDGASANDID